MSDSSNSKQGTGSPGPKGNGAAAEGPRQFGLRRFYVKDMPFEAPNSPAIFSESGLDPEMKVNLRTSHRNLGDGVSEVVLHVTVHAIAGPAQSQRYLLQ